MHRCRSPYWIKSPVSLCRVPQTHWQIGPEQIEALRSPLALNPQSRRARRSHQSPPQQRPLRQRMRAANERGCTRDSLRHACPELAELRHGRNAAIFFQGALPRSGPRASGAHAKSATIRVSSSREWSAPRPHDRDTFISGGHGVKSCSWRAQVPSSSASPLATRLRIITRVLP